MTRTIDPARARHLWRIPVAPAAPLRVVRAPLSSERAIRSMVPGFGLVSTPLVDDKTGAILTGERFSRRIRAHRSAVAAAVLASTRPAKVPYAPTRAAARKRARRAFGKGLRSTGRAGIAMLRTFHPHDRTADGPAAVPYLMGAEALAVAGDRLARGTWTVATLWSYQRARVLVTNPDAMTRTRTVTHLDRLPWVALEREGTRRLREGQRGTTKVTPAPPAPASKQDTPTDSVAQLRADAIAVIGNDGAAALSWNDVPRGSRTARRDGGRRLP